MSQQSFYPQIMPNSIVAAATATHTINDLQDDVSKTLEQASNNNVPSISYLDKFNTEFNFEGDEEDDEEYDDEDGNRSDDDIDERFTNANSDLIIPDQPRSETSQLGNQILSAAGLISGSVAMASLGNTVVKLNEPSSTNNTLSDGSPSNNPNRTEARLSAAQRNRIASSNLVRTTQPSGVRNPLQPFNSTESSSGGRHLTVSWRQLTYTVERTQYKLNNCFTSENGRSMAIKHRRMILKGVSGQFSTGQLTAVMGPSGSGKSTLLECLVGFRKKGLSGDIKMNAQTSQNVKVALINQTDYLIGVFTVRENLIYASRLKNYKRDMKEEVLLQEVVVNTGDPEQPENNLGTSRGNLIEFDKIKNYHHRLALLVAHQLGLDVCIDTKTGSCSGGQKKRISIALEMISKPNILILDEPTSGLDSSACFQTVSVMQNLTRNEQCPIAVVCTIHQPSARVFNLFDKIYIISYNGYCIYEGRPQDMLDYLSRIDLTCPQFHNPADFIAEIAAGEHGSDAVEKLIEVKNRLDLQLSEQKGSSKLLTEYSEMMDHPTTLHVYILFQRTTMNILRDPMLNSLRFLSHFLTAIFIGLLYGDSVGIPSLCPPLESPLNDLEHFPEFRKKFQMETMTTTENLAYIFFNLMFIMFGSMMPTIMTFPDQLANIRKEKINGWYSVAAYYIAMSLSEIPFQIWYPAIFSIVSYSMTGQLMEWQRVLSFTLIMIIMGFVSQSLGLMIGAMFMEDASAAVFLGPIATVPIMLFGGFFVRISTIPFYMRPFSYVSFIRYAFEACVIAIYGFERCKITPEQMNITMSNAGKKPEWMGYAKMLLGDGGEKFVDNFAKSLGGTYDPSNGKEYQSSILDHFNIDPKAFWLNLGVLFVFIAVLRTVTYFILYTKINKKT